MNLANRVIELVYDLKDRFTGKHRKITSSIKEVERATGKSASKIKKSMMIIRSSFDSILDLGKRTFLPLTATIGGMLGSVINIGSKFESLKVSLETVTGSAEDAEKAFALITDFAKETPYSVEEITQAFIKLKALGLDPSEDALRSYGNTASAMGKSLDQFVEAVADAAVGQFERLLDFGIKASSQGDQVAFTFQGITKTVGKNAAEIETYLRNIGNVQFAGGMERQTKTVIGAFSNLKDNLSALANQLYESGIGKGIQLLLEKASNGIKGFTASAKDSAESILKYAEKTTVAIVNGFSYVGVAIDALKISFNVLGGTAAGVIGIITNALSALPGETGDAFDRLTNELDQFAINAGKEIGKDFFNMQKNIQEIRSGKNTRDIEKAFNELMADIDPISPTIDMTESIRKAKAAMKEIEQEKLNINVNTVIDTAQLREALRAQIERAINSASDKSGNKE